MPPRCLLVVFLFGIVSKVQMTMEPPTAADSYNTTTNFLIRVAGNATTEHNTRETTGTSSVSQVITVADTVTGNSTEMITTGNLPGPSTAPVTGGTTPTAGAETNSSPSSETTNGTASSPPTYITTTGTTMAPTTNSNMTAQPDTTVAQTTAMGNNMTTVAQTTEMDNNMTTLAQITVSNNGTTTDDLTTVTNDNVTTMVAITPTSTDMTTNASIAPTVNYTTASMTNTPLDNDTAMTTTNNHTTENVPTTTNEDTTGTFVTVTNNATATTSDNATVSPQITSTTQSPTMGNTTALITSSPHSSNMTTTINSATSEQANTTLASSAETSGTPASTVIPFTSTDTKNTTDSSPPTSTFPGSSNTPSTFNPSPATSIESNVTMGETTTTTPLPTNSPSITTETLNTDIPTSTGGTTEIFTTFRTTGGITSSSPTEGPTTPSPVIVCPSVPCPVESVCLNGTCQCLSGNYLLNGRCVPAQVFPGRLHFQSLTFEAQMRDRSSRIFQETAANISAALRDVLKDQPGYRRSEVVQLEPGSVIASVNNIFEDSPATQASVDMLIEEAVKNPEGFLNNAAYTGTNLCEVEPLPCDVSSTKCTNANGKASCSCKDGYISMIYSNTSCKACPSGQQALQDKCETCPFGYAGFNCNDSSLLAVVIISCVLGGVLLILVLALLGYCCWKRCSRPNPDRNVSPYSDELNKSWSIGITPIPRATTHWEPAGSIEMTEGGSTNTLVDKKLESNGFGSQLMQKRWKKSGSYDLNPEDMKTFKGKNTSRYSYLVEGHENPYFLPGDEKRNSTKK
ncbi:PREDICTED: mucin-13-like [Poecilia mexicana]|uniref:mucin-13-like n=1 Tax=Poecilia mexicana TaxID=48701 RepID=UPI00072DC05A|nr:PREDICTED: mucin-13-like [Poecilia mexicana]